MPKPDSSLSAVVVSGGKQYRVAPGDRILVDRISAQPGASVKLGHVLLVSDGKDIKVGNPAVEGVEVDAKVIAHQRGPRLVSIRYKPKKRVRVHRGGRAHLTAVEIIAVGGVGIPAESPVPAERGGAESRKTRGKAKAAPKSAAAAKAETKVAEPREEGEKPKRTARRTKKEEK